MVILLFYIKLFVSIYLLIHLISRARGEQKSLLYVLLSVIILYDAQSILRGTLPQEWVPQAMLLAYLIYLTRQFLMSKGPSASFIQNFVDTKQLLRSELLLNVKEAIVLFRSDNLEVVASNANFDALFSMDRQIITIQDIVMHVNRGETKVHLLDFTNQNRTFEVRIVPYDKKLTLLYLDDVTREEVIEYLLHEEEHYYQSTWDNAPNVVMIRTRDGKVVYMNTAMEAFTRRPFSHMKGRHFTEIYFDTQEGELHNHLQESIINGTENAFRQFFKFTHVPGDTCYLDAYESLGIYKNEKHIITIGIDATSKVYASLLTQSYRKIHQTGATHSGSPYVVVDFIYNDLLFKERLSVYLDPPIESYSTFYRGLSEASKKLMSDLLINPSGFNGEALVYKNDELFVIESVITETHGNPIGILLKYVNPKASRYSLNAIGSLIVNYIKEGLLIIDYDGKIEYGNEMILRILNTDLDTLNKKNITDISKGLTLEMVHRNWLLSRQNESLYFERRYIRDDGQEVPVEIVSILLKYENTEKLMLLIRDLSEKFVYKKRLIDSQNRYAQIFQSLQDGIFEIKLPEKTVAFYRDFNSERGLMGLELTFLQWLNNIHDNDRSVVYEAVDSITSEQSSDVQFEYRYFKDGTWEWFRSTGKYIATEDGASIIMINHNITEIKSIVERLNESRHILTESERISNMAHWKYEIGKNQFSVSETFCNLTNMKSYQKKIHYEQLMEIIQWTDQSYFEEKFYSFIWQKDALNLIIRIKKAEEIVFVQFRGQVYYDDDQVPIYAIGTVMDITDRVYADQKLTESKALLENLVEQAPIGMIVIRRSGLVDMFNREAAQMLGFEQHTPGHFEQIKSHLDTHFVSLEGGSLEEHLANRTLIANNIILASKEVESKRVKLLISPMHDEEKRFFGTIINVVDASALH